MPNSISDSGSQVGTPTDANQGASQTANVKQDSQTPDVMPEWFKPFAQRLEFAEKTASKKQSEADKATAALNKQAKQSYEKEIEPIVESAKSALGLSDEQTAAYRNKLIQDEMQRRVFGSAPQELNSVPASHGSGTESAADFRELDLVKEFDLSLEDADVKQLLTQDLPEREFTKQLAKLSIARASKPNPTPAEAAPSSIKASSQAGRLNDDEIESKSAELNKLYKNPSNNKDKIAALEKELDEYWAGK